MQSAIRPWATVGVALLGAGAIAVAPMSPPPDLRAPEVGLTGLLDAPAAIAGNFYATGASTAVALLDQIPEIMVVDPAVVALRNLILSVPVAFESDDPIVALESLGGLLANAVVGFGQAAVRDVAEFAAAVSSLIPQLLTNIGVAITTLDPLDIPEAVANAVLGTVVGLAGLGAPGPLSIVGAGVLAGTNLAQNLPIILDASIDRVLSGDPGGALQTLTGPVAAAVLGVVGVAIPGLVPAAAAATTLLPQLGPTLRIGLEVAFERALAGDPAGAFSALTGPVVNTIAGIAQAAWTSSSAPSIETVGAPERVGGLDNRRDLTPVESVPELPTRSVNTGPTLTLDLSSVVREKGALAEGQKADSGVVVAVLEKPAAAADASTSGSPTATLADLEAPEPGAGGAAAGRSGDKPGTQLRGAIRNVRSTIRGATTKLVERIADVVGKPGAGGGVSRDTKVPAGSPSAENGDQ